MELSWHSPENLVPLLTTIFLLFFSKSLSEKAFKQYKLSVSSVIVVDPLVGRAQIHDHAILTTNICSVNEGDFNDVFCFFLQLPCRESWS
jgi:hypothetical protein